MSTVVIGPPEHLDVLISRQDLPDAQAFADADALRALEAITRLRPSVVALERLFAGTSRGTALINRIKADPSLASSEIRIVAHDDASISLHPVSARPASAGPGQLDASGTRDAPRTTVAPGIEVLIDGNPAALVDASASGLQVISPTILKPNQRVRVTLPASSGSIRIAAAVAWASFEMPKTGPRYRAGIGFIDADAAAIVAWVAGLRPDARATEPPRPATDPPPTLP